MSLWLIWILAAVALLIVEVLTQMVWTLCLSIGCIFAMACELLGIDLPWQIIVLSVVALASYILLVPKIKRLHDRALEKEGRKDCTGMDALLGRKAVVTHEIEPGRLGRARIDGDSWQVKAPGIDRTIRRGEEVTVTAYDSIILSVQP